MPSSGQPNEYPVIVIPATTGTALLDYYPVDPDEVWGAIMHQEYPRLSMHPDNLVYEAKEPARIRAANAFGIVYGDLIGALRHELSPSADCPTPVYPFGYDWRQDVRETAKLLHSAVEEVIARTQLLRHYSPWYPKDSRVHLVAHSMGGLVLCEYLKQFGDRKRVGKICTLCTPFQGSIEAVAKLLTGMGYLAGETPAERERETARTLQSVYQLLPSFPGAAKRDSDGVSVDLFKASEWQPSLIESLREFVRLYSVVGAASADDPGNAALAASILETMLSGASGLVADVRQLAKSLESASIPTDDWLAIVGVGSQTRVEVEVSTKDGAPWFRVEDQAFVDDWSKDHSSNRTGDSTVPLEGAIAPFLARETHVAVTPGDFGFWELRDRIVQGLAGFHSQVPNLNLAQRLAIRHFRPTYTGDVWGRRVPGVANWAPPITGLREQG